MAPPSIRRLYQTSRGGVSFVPGVDEADAVAESLTEEFALGFGDLVACEIEMFEVVQRRGGECAGTAVAYLVVAQIEMAQLVEPGDVEQSGNLCIRDFTVPKVEPAKVCER